MKLKNGVEIVSLDNRLARVRLNARFDAAGIRVNEQLVQKLKDPAIVSQWTEQGKNDNFNFQTVNDVMPRDGDYILVKFRALSKTVVPGHWIDWTRDNVLEESVSLLPGATVYPNHNFYDIQNWLGSVNQAVWDPTGAAAKGVPGINAEYKIDALMNPRIARGLLMSPPAIHSTSMTVLFEFEYSHPEMAAESKYKFMNNLGENVDGEIVRLIVTKIVEYWEASLVFQGADRLAKIDTDDGGDPPQQDDDDDFAEMQRAADLSLPNSNEEKKMKLSNETKTSLGIEFDGDEVPETEILKAAETLAQKLATAVDSNNIAELSAKAAAGEKLVKEKREDVVRLAKLAELGAADGELDPVIAAGIEEADVDRLQQLGAYYQKKAGDKFPAGGRSSQEDPKDVDAAGGKKTEELAVPTVGVL